MNFKISCMIILSLFLISFVSAQPPLQQTNDFGIQIESPVIEFHEQGEKFEFYLHAHNSSSGLFLANDTTSCLIHLYNSSGDHIVERNMSFYDDLDFEFEVDGGNFSNLGQYAVLFYCEVPGERGGFLEYSFEITSNGKEITYNYLIATLILILTFLGLGILIYKDKEKMDHEKYWTSMFKKYMNRNYLRLSFVIVWYNIKKNSFILYYLIGLVNMIMIYDVSIVYNLTAIEPVFQILLYLYTWGALIMVILLFGNVQEWIKEWLESIEKINWGELTSPK